MINSMWALAVTATGHQRFELDGADTAADYLRMQDMSADRIQTVWDAIALHTSPGIAERRAPEVALTRAGISTDFGHEAEAVPDDLADTIHTAYPRLDMARTLTDAIVRHAADNPSRAPRYTTPGELVRERANPPFLTRMEQTALDSHWGS